MAWLAALRPTRTKHAFVRARQGFTGLFSIEYEPYSPDNLPKIAQCVAFFDKVAAELLGA